VANVSEPTIRRAKDLSQEQKTAIESLLGRVIKDNEAIIMRTVPVDESGEFAHTDSVSAPDWLQNSWENAKRLGLDRLSMEEIDTEIKAARRARRNPPTQQ
jgi:hypothetical protein